MAESDGLMASDPHERCSRCGHDRKWHGEGGCNHEPPLMQRVLAGNFTRCGCLRPQGLMR